MGQGNGSWARVTAGVRVGLEENGSFGGFFDVGEVSDSDVLGDGFDARVGLCIGSPGTASVMVGRGMHERRMLLVASNSSWLPRSVMESAEKSCTDFVAPSEWAAEVIRSYTDLPVRVYRHGVDDGFYRSSEKALEQRLKSLHARFRVLHLTSSSMQRKGTEELIWAWADAMEAREIPSHGVLLLICDAVDPFQHVVAKAVKGRLSIAESILVRGRRGMTIEEARALYLAVDVVCQPSRGEGFGMVPLEARACGTPVMATDCTGHSEHMVASGGVMLVPTGPDMPIDDGPGAVAPQLKRTYVREALVSAYIHRRDLVQDAWDCAPTVGEAWSWPRVTRDFLESSF